MEGICRLCKKHRPLTYEHIPPRSAFNKSSIKVSNIMDWIHRPEGERNGTIHQRGMGIHGLCSDCNNKTGTWYVPELAEWTRVGMDILHSKLPREVLEQADATLDPDMHGALKVKGVYPLRFLKQIITMLLTLNHTEFDEGLRSFVIDRERRGLPSGCDVFLCLYLGPHIRFAPLGAIHNMHTETTTVLTEVAYPPFSYSLTLGSDHDALPMGKINHFAEYRYDQSADIEIEIPIGFGNTPLAHDFRSKAKVAEDARSN